MVCIPRAAHRILAPARAVMRHSRAVPTPPVSRAGEQLEVIEGVNAPALAKTILDHIPEGMIDTEDADVAAGEEEEEYES